MPAAVPGGYYGPTGMGEIKGATGDARPPRQALDRDVARRLWTVSEQLTGTAFPVLAAAA